MKIGYADEEIQKICTNAKYAYKKIGAANSNKLFRKLHALTAVDNLQEFYDSFSSWRPHPLKGNRKGSHSFSIEGRLRLIFLPVDFDGNEAEAELAYILIETILIKEVSNHYGD